MKIGFIASCFDLLHAGHVSMIEEASEQCDHLIIALQSDPTIDRATKNKPVQGLYERWTQLNGLKHVDQIIPYDSEVDLKNMLVTQKPEIRFLGSDYKGKPFTGDDLGHDVVYIDRTHTWSSSNLREDIKKT